MELHFELSLALGISEEAAQTLLEVLRRNPDTVEALLEKHPSITTAPRARQYGNTLPEPTEATKDKLCADVRFILDNSAFMEAIIGGDDKSPPGYEDLLAAWQELDEPHRAVCRLAWNLGGQGIQTPDQIAEVIGQRVDVVRRFLSESPRWLNESLWPKHGFKGLERNLAAYLLSVGVEQPEDLSGRVVELLEDNNPFGMGKFQQIIAWLQQNGHTTLAETLIGKLNPDFRRKYHKMILAKK